MAFSLQDYKDLVKVGQGGMATVYLAHDVRHDRKVALKVLRPELSAILGAERFLDALAGAPAVGNEDEDAEERPRDKRGNPRRPSKKARAAARALRRLRSS